MVLASAFSTVFIAVIVVIILLAVGRNVMRHGWRGLFKRTGGPGADI